MKIWVGLLLGFTVVCGACGELPEDPDGGVGGAPGLPTHLTTCEDSSECRLRYGTGCCESCGGGTVVAFSSRVDLRAALCLPFPLPNPACNSPCVGPPLPADLQAVCLSGKCIVANKP